MFEQVGRSHGDGLRALACAYLEIKRTVIEAGYASEIDWQEDVSLGHLTETEFLRQAAWVVLSSGMRESVIRRHFEEITIAFLDWRSAGVILANETACRSAALRVFGHTGKINAILSIATHIVANGFQLVHERLFTHGIEHLRELPYLGPVTSLHLAKNIGIAVAKPDRHLCRIAKTLNYASPAKLCDDIARLVPDPIGVVDLVLWRYATLDRGLALLPTISAG